MLLVALTFLASPASAGKVGGIAVEVQCVEGQLAFDGACRGPGFFSGLVADGYDLRSVAGCDKLNSEECSDDAVRVTENKGTFSRTVTLRRPVDRAYLLADARYSRGGEYEVLALESISSTWSGSTHILDTVAWVYDDAVRHKGARVKFKFFEPSSGPDEPFRQDVWIRTCVEAGADPIAAFPGETYVDGDTTRFAIEPCWDDECLLTWGELDEPYTGTDGMACVTGSGTNAFAGDLVVADSGYRAAATTCSEGDIVKSAVVGSAVFAGCYAQHSFVDGLQILAAQYDVAAMITWLPEAEIVGAFIGFDIGMVEHGGVVEEYMLKAAESFGEVAECLDQALEARDLTIETLCPAECNGTYRTEVTVPYGTGTCTFETDITCSGPVDSELGDDDCECQVVNQDDWGTEVEEKCGGAS